MNFLITGGSRGIGEAIVLQAAQGGHNVAFTYREQAERAQSVRQRAQEIAPNSVVKCYQMDVRDSGSVERAGDAILDDFDNIDVIVLNAGVNQPNLLVQMSDEEWDDVIRTNLTGAFYVARYFLPPMMSRRFGRFIMISSLAYTGMTGQANYCASKAGLHGLASAIAKEYGRRGITANVVVPAIFDTDMSREGLSTSNREFWIQYCPLGRIGKLSELSSLVTFLASEPAGYINGQAIEVNGGLDWAP
jgi:NAD(P)-dependent dehydrogenase (short-subunit alcohol dehydrogenase family)